MLHNENQSKKLVDKWTVIWNSVCDTKIIQTYYCWGIVSLKYYFFLLLNIE